MTLVAIVVWLTGCADGPTLLSQAGALPALAPKPPPSFPAPSYTPAGAGASPLGQPWRMPEAQVERSPNKRVLPVDPTDPSPGLWAADEVRGSAGTPPQLAEVELPVPDSDISGLETRYCALDMQSLLKREGQLAQMMALRPDDRRCVAAQLYEYCWKSELSTAKSSARRERLDAANEQIRSFVAYSCRNTRGKPSTDKILNAVKRAWELTKKGKR